MTTIANSVRIALGSVVLDRPDRSGQYIAKDLAGGWAYLIADSAGDNRFRGQGVCAGGLEIGLRCAFLSAAGCVEDTRRITVFVETPQAHRAMVQLATSDPRTVAAIAGRQVSIMTRPHDRSSFQVRSAAERVAAAALFERERREWRAAADAAGDAAAQPQATTIAAEPVTYVASPPRPTWRSRVGAADVPVADFDVVPVTDPGANAGASPVAEAAPAVVAVRLPDPVIRVASPLDWVPVAPAPHRPPASRNRVLTDWLTAFDDQVASLAVDLRDVGA